MRLESKRGRNRETVRDRDKNVEGEGGKESERFMGAERMRLLKRGMKWYCSLFPFGSFCVFVKLCQIAEPKPCAVGALMCVYMCQCVYVEKKREVEGKYVKM